MNNHIENEEMDSYALISYKNAVKYFDNALILCNNITEIDEYLWENCDLCNTDEAFFQYFLTDCSQGDAERLHQWFGLNLLYSGKLGLYILCVEHWGTSWDYVPCPVFDQNVADYIKNNGLEFKH